MHQYLSPVFLDASVLKIFHAMESLDIKILDRDWNLHVVHSMDTYQMAYALDYDKLGSLVYSIQYCAAPSLLCLSVRCDRPTDRLVDWLVGWLMGWSSAK